MGEREEGGGAGILGQEKVGIIPQGRQPEPFLGFCSSHAHNVNLNSSDFSENKAAVLGFTLNLQQVMLTYIVVAH